MNASATADGSRRARAQSYPPLDSLSQRCKRLVEGNDWGRYESTYKALSAVLGGLCRAGWTETEALALCLDQSQRVGQRLHDKWHGEVVSQVQSKWRAVERKHRRHDSNIVEWCNVLLTYWPLDGRGGAKLRVALALAAIAHDAGSLTFTASMRQIGEVAGVGYASDFAQCSDTKTVRKALGWLKGARVIEIGQVATTDQEDQLFNATTEFTLVEPGGLSSQLREVCTSHLTKFPSGTILWISGVNTSQSLLHPVFEHVGLGMTACRVWHLLKATNRPLKVGEVASVLRVSRRAIYSALDKLDESHLVSTRGAGLWTPLHCDLDDVAEDLGLQRRPENRRRANRQQRANRREALLNSRRAWRVEQQCSPFDADPFGPAPMIEAGHDSIVDPFTGEIFNADHVVAVARAATVLLGGTTELVEVAS